MDVDPREERLFEAILFSRPPKACDPESQTGAGLRKGRTPPDPPGFKPGAIHLCTVGGAKTRCNGIGLGTVWRSWPQGATGE